MGGEWAKCESHMCGGKEIVVVVVVVVPDLGLGSPLIQTKHHNHATTMQDIKLLRE